MTRTSLVPVALHAFTGGAGSGGALAHLQPTTIGGKFKAMLVRGAGKSVGVPDADLRLAARHQSGEIREAGRAAKAARKHVDGLVKEIARLERDIPALNRRAASLGSMDVGAAELLIVERMGKEVRLGVLQEQLPGARELARTVSLRAKQLEAQGAVIEAQTSAALVTNRVVGGLRRAEEAMTAPEGTIQAVEAVNRQIGVDAAALSVGNRMNLPAGPDTLGAAKAIADGNVPSDAIRQELARVMGELGAGAPRAISG